MSRFLGPASHFWDRCPPALTRSFYDPAATVERRPPPPPPPPPHLVPADGICPTRLGGRRLTLSSPQFLVCKRKLESKKDALLILSKELDTCQQERDQYRLMANQLRERHQGLKKKYRELIVSAPPRPDPSATPI